MDNATKNATAQLGNPHDDSASILTDGADVYRPSNPRSTLMNMCVCVSVLRWRPDELNYFNEI